jgi:hypothetical protein
MASNYVRQWIFLLKGDVLAKKRFLQTMVKKGTRGSRRRESSMSQRLTAESEPLRSPF